VEIRFRSLTSDKKEKVLGEKKKAPWMLIIFDCCGLVRRGGLLGDRGVRNRIPETGSQVVAGGADYAGQTYHDGYSAKSKMGRFPSSDVVGKEDVRFEYEGKGLKILFFRT